MIMRVMISGFADQVLDGGDFLRVRQGDVEEDIVFDEIEAVKEPMWTRRPPRIEILRTTSGKLSRAITFIPIEYSWIPFKKSALTLELEERVARLDVHAVRAELPRARDRHRRMDAELARLVARGGDDASRRAASRALSLGCSTISTSAMTMKTGTIALKYDAGSSSSRIAPVMPPVTEATPSRIARAFWPSS